VRVSTVALLHAELGAGARTAPAPAPATLSVNVGPVSIPAIVDLPQIVVSTGPNQVAIDEFNRWASPLANNISRVVAEDLVVMLGTPRVSLFQQSLNVDAAYRVAIEVQTFESAPGDAASLNAVWIVRRAKDGRSHTGRTTVREPDGRQELRRARGCPQPRARPALAGRRRRHPRARPRRP
jgi:uncharacterized lipoprotein YmbA